MTGLKDVLLVVLLGMYCSCTGQPSKQSQSIHESIVGDWAVVEAWLNGKEIHAGDMFHRFDSDGVFVTLWPSKGVASYGTYSLSPKGDSLVFGTTELETLRSRCMLNGDTMKLTNSSSAGIGRIKCVRVNYTSQDSIHKYAVNSPLVSFKPIRVTPRGDNMVDLETRVDNSSSYSFRDVRFQVSFFGELQYFKALKEGKVTFDNSSIDILPAHSSVYSKMTIQWPDYKVVGGPEYVIHRWK